jgi:hypothetical protein
MKYTYTPGNYNVNYLEAPYELLVRAFGDDGTVSPRDDYKSMCEWDIQTEYGEVVVYDYKVGKCYDRRDGLDREEITEWHVQGDENAIQAMLGLLALLSK